ncbi:MAG: C45 family peptidase [Candidatus Acidiferrales bacterium]
MSSHKKPLICALVIALGCTLFAAQFFARAGRPAAEAASPAAARQDSVYETTRGRGYRFERGGWIYVHLEGSPHDIGVQHGYLLSPEIADGFQVVRLEATHSSGYQWDFFRRAAREMLWPKIDPEYQAELQGITDGLQDHGVKLDLWDVVAMNAFAELPDYYVPWLKSQTNPTNTSAISEGTPRYGHCSAFVATGSWTKDHQIVMAHNNWTTYAEGVRWNIIFDIVPQQGYRILMDGFPGVIASDDDFGVNSAGIMVTETTIANFHGWNPNGKPEFVRARKAMQYAHSIDDYVKIMLDGNNGGYANDWLLGDRKTGEIARFELGLKHTKVWRATDGYFAGSNFPSDPALIRDETTFDPADPANSANARHVRWDQLMQANKGKIDTALAQTFLADHFDTYTKKEGANLRTLCGHGDASIEGIPSADVKPYDPSGAVQGKVMDSGMAAAMSFVARIGHPCGANFDAAKFLADHPEFSWQSPILRDMDAGPWTPFRMGEHAPEQMR